MANQCKLGGTNLPLHFRYEPATPQTRFVAYKTGGGGLTIQGKAPTAGDAVIKWTMEGCTKAEWLTMLGFYSDANRMTTTYTFTGYWGDSYTVLALNMDPPKVGATLFDLSGEFQIVAVTKWGQ